MARDCSISNCIFICIFICILFTWLGADWRTRPHRRPMFVKVFPHWSDLLGNATTNERKGLTWYFKILRHSPLLSSRLLFSHPLRSDANNANNAFIVISLISSLCHHHLHQQLCRFYSANAPTRSATKPHLIDDKTQRIGDR